MNAILIGTPVTPRYPLRNTIPREEFDMLSVPDEISKINKANNNPKNQVYKGHIVYTYTKDPNSVDFIERQGSYAPDSDVKKVSKSAMIINNQFRKTDFVDGSNIIAPKGYLPTGSDDNGTKKQGINTVFKIKEPKGNGEPTL